MKQNTDYSAKIQDALNFIEAPITDELDVHEIAKQAGFSTFYFQRIFGLLCGMPLKEYVRNRRLALAGAQLAGGKRKITDVAYEFGYDSPESFTRAFVKFHGTTPSEVKRGGAKILSFSPVSIKTFLNGGTLMNYKITEKEFFYVLEKVSEHTVENDSNLKTIPEFWSQCKADGTMDVLLKNAADDSMVFGVCYAQKDGPRFEYSVAVICDENARVPEGFRKNKIPRRTWATFECVGSMPDAVQQTWNKIVTEFFPAFPYRPTCEFDIEAYPDGDTDSPDYICEIWIPVEKI